MNVNASEDRPPAGGFVDLCPETSDNYAWVVPGQSLWRCDPGGPMPVVDGDRFREYLLSGQGFCL